MKHKAYVRFPKTGLGNLLLIWSRAKVFSHLNGLPLVASSWWGFRWGSILRNETQKRIYWGYFHESRLLDRLKIPLTKSFYKIETEPRIEKFEKKEQNTIFYFNEVSNHNDLFREIRAHRDYIISELKKLIKPRLWDQLKQFDVPEISMHIRRGDFRFGNPITPNDYFIECIKFIRKAAGRQVGVTIFTDAKRHEIEDILQLENVRLAEPKPDILDILLMSKSKVIVLSRSSTFGYWSAFLSEAIVIKHFDDWQGDLRPREINQKRFEGKINFSEPETLVPLEEALKKEVW